MRTGDAQQQCATGEPGITLRRDWAEIVGGPGTLSSGNRYPGKSLVIEYT